MTTATRDVEAAEGRLLAHDHIPHAVVDRLPPYTRALPRLPALPGFLREHPVDVAVLAMPPSRAQAVADALVRGGVQAILNYAAVAIHVPERVLLRHIDAIAKLQEMTFYLNRKHDAVLARNEAALPRENLERGAMK